MLAIWVSGLSLNLFISEKSNKETTSPFTPVQAFAPDITEKLQKHRN